MRITKASRALAALVACLSLISFAAFPPLKGRASNTFDKEPKGVIRVTPPAPVFDEAARLQELASRRARVMEQAGPTSVIVLFSGEPRVYTNDVDYEFRQENNLYYLTNLKQRGATLVLMPGNPQLPMILFMPKRDPAAETWTGHMYSPEEARKISGINEIWEAGEFEPFMRALRLRQPYRPKADALLMSSTSMASAQPVTPPVPQAAQTTAAASVATPARAVASQSQPNLVTTNAPSTAQTPTQAIAAQQAMASTAAQPAAVTGYETLFAAMGKGDATLYLLLPRESESREYKMEQSLAEQWARSATGLNVRNAAPIFMQMRLRKSPMELQIMQHAIDITTEGFGRAMAVAGRSQWEYEVEAEIDYTFKRRNADNWGYPSIVGCGPNATTLHYVESQGRINKGDLLLMDVGAEYDHYTADVTRTFPVSGKFTPEQAEIYNIVYAAQEAVAKATRPGATLTDVHNAGAEVIKDGLLRLGLITDRNSNQYRIWFMHGTSHWLGMNVHDVGTRDTKFEPGMVFTNEPGIYIRGDALDYLPKTPENEKFIAAVRPAFEKYKNIGVRIEDDLVVTADGCRWMTAALPRSIPDIEAFIARASRELGARSAIDENLRDLLLLRPINASLYVDNGFGLDTQMRQLELWQPFSLNDFPVGRTVRRTSVYVGSAQADAKSEHHHDPVAGD
jgi:Xaa-Pro aminopeptidase